LTAGEVSGAPEIVLLPGLGAPGYLAPWARQSAAWTRATILDLPGWHLGRGRSSQPTLDGVASATAEWLAETDRSGVVLLGHSTGAQAILRTVPLVPERVAAVVLAGPTFAPEIRSFRRLVLPAMRTFSRERRDEVPTVAPSYLHSGGWSLLRLLRASLRDRPELRVPHLSSPLLVIAGELDRLAPPSWGRHLAQLASARCVVIPGAHNACFPHAEAADAAVREAVAGWR
jgi:pimeloyl-ACP methyl ester carboxylesterase